MAPSDQEAPGKRTGPSNEGGAKVKGEKVCRTASRPPSMPELTVARCRSQAPAAARVPENRRFSKSMDEFAAVVWASPSRASHDRRARSWRQASTPAGPEEKPPKGPCSPAVATRLLTDA